MSVIMDAKPLFARIKEQVKSDVEFLKKKGVNPGLSAVLTSEDAISHTYVFFKQRDCKEVGINSQMFDLSKKDSKNREIETIKTVKGLNDRNDIHGIIVQMPLPEFVNIQKVFETLSPEKDVDGLTPYRLGKLMRGEYSYNSSLLPCTPRGVVELLEHYKVSVAGKDVAIVGRSVLVGNPLRKMLEDKGATAICYHSKTKNMKEKLKVADVVISAVGRPPEMYKENSFRLTADMIKDDAIVVGVGVRKDMKNDKLYFDVDVDSVKEKASLVTPNIGGVGLMTRAMLLKNTIIACKNLNGLP